MPQAPTVELPKRLPLVVEAANRDDTTAKDARLINCFAERTPEGGVWIYKRPGLLQDSQPAGGAAAGYGCFNWNGSVYAIFGTHLYKDGVSVGTVDATNGVYRFSSCLGATPKLIFGNATAAYWYAGTGSVTQITFDPQADTTFVKGWAYVDGTTYIMDISGRIWGDEINTPTNWTFAPDNMIRAQIEPDFGAALAKQLVYVIALKQWSTEVFFNAGNATGSPLGQVAGAKLNVGCASAGSVQDLEGTLVWLAVTRSVSLHVVSMTGLKLDVVSTEPIERLLQNASLANVYSWQMRVSGHRFYVLTLATQNLTLVYDLDQKLWWQMTDVDGNYFPIVAATYDNNLKHILQHESNGKLYKADMNYTTDDGATITCDIYTPNFDGGVRRRKMLARMEVIGDQTAGSLLRVRSNDHDYDPARWTNYRILDMSKQRPFITDCGTFYRRVHHFQHQSPTRLRIQAVELQMDIGTL